MKYTLALLTSPGRDTLGATLSSFERFVTPRPMEMLAYVDGDTSSPPVMYDGRAGWHVDHSTSRKGFCRATRALWKHVLINGTAPYVFWLEDDFAFTRPIDLRNLGMILDRQQQVMQMALYRNPVNEDEKAAGGYIAQHPEEYERRGGGTTCWYEHRHHFTTNPSLFRRSLLDLDWPDGPFCEGKFGGQLRQLHPEATFGIWGSGDVWVQHTGERVGSGY